MKVLGIQLGSLTARAHRQRRAQMWQSFIRLRDGVPKLCVGAFRGNSAQAAAVRRCFGEQVEAVLSAMLLWPTQQLLKVGKNSTTQLLISIQMVASHPPRLQQVQNVVLGFTSGLRNKGILLVDRFLRIVKIIYPIMLLNWSPDGFGMVVQSPRCCVSRRATL